MFRLGPWRGERTADAPVELPRSALRADHVDPPPPIVDTTSRAFMSPELMARFRETAAQVMAEASAEDADFKRAWESLQAFRAKNAEWQKLAFPR